MTKATNIIMVPIRIRFLITPLLGIVGQTSAVGGGDEERAEEKAGEGVGREKV